MRVISLNVSRPQRIEWRGRDVQTSIFKLPADGPQRVHRLGILGNAVADLTVHGGVNKAVYVYPSEHYEYWRVQLPETRFDWGAFGENLTTEGLLEDETFIGDTLLIGTAEFVVTQPRMPCYKLGVRFDRLDMTKRFADSGLPGFYLSVRKPGIIQTGSIITLIPGERRNSSIAGIFREALR